MCAGTWVACHSGVWGGVLSGPGQLEGGLLSDCGGNIRERGPEGHYLHNFYLKKRFYSIYLN